MAMIKWTLDIVLAEDQQTHKNCQCDLKINIESKNRMQNAEEDTVLLFALVLILLNGIHT